MVYSEHDVKIIIATHKRAKLPDDAMYLPLQVGASGKDSIGYSGDDTGENISDLNPFFCEMTGLYWAWKNLDAEYIGLVHYRRYFSLHPFSSDKEKHILTYRELQPFLGRIKIFLPAKRRYFIESLYSHYKHTHYAEQLEETGRIIRERYPGYSKLFYEVVNRRWGYMFNMLIMKRELLNEYCLWLFDILFELRKRIGEKAESELSSYQGRLYGRISEIIFNVWLEKMLSDGEIRKNEIKEIPVILTGKTRWVKKCTAFLMAKFFGKKYESSF